jgi:hypothetical protein
VAILQAWRPSNETFRPDLAHHALDLELFKYYAMPCQPCPSVSLDLHFPFTIAICLHVGRSYDYTSLALILPSPPSL